MKKIIWIAVIVVVGLVLAYNGYLVFKMFRPKPTGEKPRQTTAASAAPNASQTPINVTPTKTPEPTLVPVKSSTRKPLPAYFLISEVACHIRISGESLTLVNDKLGADEQEIPPYTRIIAEYLKCTPEHLAKMMPLCESFEMIVTENGEYFYSLSFPKFARDMLAGVELGADNLKDLITLEGGKAYFGKFGGERFSRIRDNEPFPDNRGAYADEVANFKDATIFVRLTRKFIDFSGYALHHDILKYGNAISVAWADGFTTFTVKWDGGPEWIGQLAIDPRVAVVPFVPAASPFAMAVALNREVERDLVVNAFQSVLGFDAKLLKEFKESLGITPTELSKYARSRFFMFFPDPDDDIIGSNAVYGFDLKQSVTLEDLLKSLKKGDIFGDEKPMTMLYKGRKISFPGETQTDPGFSISMINDVLLMSPSNALLRRSIDTTLDETLGFFHDMENDRALKLSDGASIILRFAPNLWPLVYKDIPEMHGSHTTYVAYKFSRAGLSLQSNLEPTNYIAFLLDQVLVRNRR